MTQRKLWTCVIDFRGGTYVHQVWTADLRDVLPAVLAELPAQVPELASPLQRVSANEVRSAVSGITRLDGLHAVSCVTLTVGEDLLVANIIETVTPAS